MVKHIVLWAFRDNAEGQTKEQNPLLAKQRLEALKNNITSTRHVIGYEI